MTKPIIQPPEPDTLGDEERAFWRETGRSLVKASLPALDDTAKQFVTVAGILTGPYYNAVAFSKIPEKPGLAQHLGAYLAPIGLLLLSLIAALVVFLPDRHGLNLLSSEAAKLVYKRVVRRKLWALRLAGFFLVLGVLAILYGLMLYLQG
jgi:hypothetical protein